jgi:hypothetical protein
MHPSMPKRKPKASTPGQRQRRAGAGRPPATVDANELDADKKRKQAAILALYAEGKHTLEGAAQKGGSVSISTLWRWRAADAEFDAQVTMAKKDVEGVQVQLVEDSWIQRVIKGKCTPSEIFFFLVNRAPDRWRSVNRVEHTGAGGGPIRHADLSKLTNEQVDKLYELLAAAGLEVR